MLNPYRSFSNNPSRMSQMVSKRRQMPNANMFNNNQTTNGPTQGTRSFDPSPSVYNQSMMKQTTNGIPMMQQNGSGIPMMQQNGLGIPQMQQNNGIPGIPQMQYTPEGDAMMEEMRKGKLIRWG